MMRGFFGARTRVLTRFGAIAGAATLVVGLTPVTSTIGAYATSTTRQTYIVLAKQEHVSARLLSKLRLDGGTIVASYDAIGVVIVKAGDAKFASRAQGNIDVEAAANTNAFSFRLKPSPNDDGADQGGNPGSQPATDSDHFSALQWDMKQIQTPEAHAITGGSPAVLVGDIDTGLDYTHPDLAPNVDDANSVNCLSGSPVPGKVAAMDVNGHGTHTAGTIAAAANGIGIVGVAPNVRIAGIKAGNQDGFFFPQAVVCAFMWAGSHHFNVTNNSYFADPYYFNCKNDPIQRAILKAESRAIAYAQRHGVTVVAAAGNFADDLANPTQDRQSPDDTTPVTRPVTKACVVIPVQIPGVIGVSATGSLRMKSFYSNYGTDVINVAAPGGDSILQATPAPANGRVLSAWPMVQLFPPGDPRNCRASRTLFDTSVSPPARYCYAQGTSMASPHVTGLVALVISQFGEMSSRDILRLLERTADPIACPTAAVLAQYNAVMVSANNDAPQTCTGPATNNSWYGHGEVNALKAITSEGDNNQNH